MTQHKWPAIALVAGGILMFLRMGPVMAVIPDDMLFPPPTTEELVRLAVIAEGRWQLSHALALAAVALLLGGYWGLLKPLGRSPMALAGLVAATLAFGLFAVALVLDGFLVPALATAAANQADIDGVAEAHAWALLFFTPGVFAMFVAMVLLASRMLHRILPSRWLGIIGQLIGIGAITLYLFGLAGPHWDNMQIGGSMMLLGFFWHIVAGVVNLRNTRLYAKAARANRGDPQRAGDVVPR